MQNDYLLLTPGPISTSQGVRQAMLKDWCTWDSDYNLGVVEVIRKKIVDLATRQTDKYTSVLMQGSGTASVEATLGSALKKSDKLLVINNGAYGARIAEIANRLNIQYRTLMCSETASPDINELKNILVTDSAITHVAVVHCETTTGMLNPIEKIIRTAKKYKKCVILDAMSSFGGIPLDMGDLEIDFLISSANKCIQGVPGFGFVIAKRCELDACKGQARSLSLDLYDQWHCMEVNHGKWRFTSPTHTVRAFTQALTELEEEGGVTARYQRYQTNQVLLVEGMRQLGFKTLLEDRLHSPVITSFYSPSHSDYQFKLFYDKLKALGFVIYPGKVSDADCFRIGSIGEVYPDDIERLIYAIQQSMYWKPAP